MEVGFQIGFHVRWLETCQRAGVDSFEEGGGERDCASDLEVVCLVALAFGASGGVGVVDENAVGTD